MRCPPRPDGLPAAIRLAVPARAQDRFLLHLLLAEKAGMRAGNFCAPAPQFNPSEEICHAPQNPTPGMKGAFSNRCHCEAGVNLRHSLQRPFICKVLPRFPPGHILPLRIYCLSHADIRSSRRCPRAAIPVGRRAETLGTEKFIGGGQSVL